jgi:hypothetical protein
MPHASPPSAGVTLPLGLAARTAALASGGVALMLALVTRDAYSAPGQVLFGSFLGLVLLSAWLLWYRDDFMVRALTIGVMTIIGLGSLLACTVGLPGRATGDFAVFDVTLAVLAFAICGLLGLDSWLRDRSAP